MIDREIPVKIILVSEQNEKEKDKKIGFVKTQIHNIENEANFPARETRSFIV